MILLGATGYTGRLVAGSLVEMGERPVLAGRTASRLRAMAVSLGGLDTAVADVSRPQSVKEIVGEGDVLVSTVGPFTLYGNVALDAALGAGAHYLDSTGEPAFIRRVFAEAGPVAEGLGITLLTAFGIDWVPGNVAGALAAEKAGPGARRLDIAYLIRPKESSGDPSEATAGRDGADHPPPPGRGKQRGPVISTGTRASIIAASAAPQHARRGGALVLEPASRHARSFKVDGQVKRGTSVGGSEPLALTGQYPHLDEIGVYLSLPGPVWVAQGLVLGLSIGLGAIGTCRLAVGPSKGSYGWQRRRPEEVHRLSRGLASARRSRRCAETRRTGQSAEWCSRATSMVTPCPVVLWPGERPHCVQVNSSLPELSVLSQPLGSTNASPHLPARA